MNRLHRGIAWLFTWNGTVTRSQYFVAGSVLLGIKYLIDRQIASLFGQRWEFWSYFFPRVAVFRFNTMFLVMSAVALPFFWIGIALTLRRLRSTGQRTALVFLFFVPVVNLAFFIALSLAPEAGWLKRLDSQINPLPPFEEYTDQSNGWTSVVLSVLVGALLVFMGVYGFRTYGAVMFIGSPFAVGFVSATAYNHQRLRTLGSTFSVAAWTLVALGVALVAVAFEGLACILMLLPLALLLGMSGALLGWRLQQCRHRPGAAPTVAMSLVLLPLLMFGESAAHRTPPVLPVTTSVEINASPDVVWHNVISFSPLDSPKELLFHTGIAYPTSAVIMGSGVGAVRYCQFSTGDFVEPITEWQPGRLLAFDVKGQPPSMREMSPWNITPPHIEKSYMRSLHGQFKLVSLPGGRTRLEGTTWYQNYFWPQPYWRVWSDFIVHRIHQRVLKHVQAESEHEAALSPGGAPVLRPR